MWRVVVFGLAIALGGNAFLASIVSDDTFVYIISVASGVVAVALVILWFIAPKWVDDLLLASLAIWVANIIEFATESNVLLETQIRQCTFYGSFAVMSIGAYVAKRTAVT